jgi:rubredoxin
MADRLALNSTLTAARDRLPANFAGLRAVATKVEGNAVIHELACECGGEEGQVKATPDGGDLAYLDPVSFECAKCGNSVTFFDSSRDGYDGRLNDGACYHQGQQPNIVRCQDCGGSSGKLACGLVYNIDFEAEGELESLAEVQDYFDFIEIARRCPSCGVTTYVGQWELA